MLRNPVTGPLVITVLIITTVSECGVMPTGQARTTSFTVSDFRLPVSMVYSERASCNANVKRTMGVTPHCVIVGNTVTATCPEREVGGVKMVGCMVGVMNVDVETISANHTTISGTLTTTNIIMANWSIEMWQGILSRAIRMLAAGPFASQFSSAFGTIG
ncbi:hypothetical protein KIN20_032906 [Parelaphostrongylus tenuis]|uniref:Uncharacterized protein n=1 Tax=Parelaphostrongylus tenuis TaxID=148309 RepID=A0AAD5R7E8_PARTN|nr:hypothetical protein KIN20_032906 [Parelaphostrongylus tenuis]